MQLPDFVCCPRCRGRLDALECTLECARCGRRYEVEDGGIPRLLDPEAPGLEAKLRELAAWPELAREQGWYEADDRIDAALPFLCRDLGWDDTAWRATERGFEELLRRVEPGMRVLEIGAAKSWAAQHLLPRGCEYVAADLVVDPLIGLGRGTFFEERAGKPYLRVQADGERLPFADASFDVAFCVATLHHAIDLTAMVGELGRVTRRGGLVAALNEGTRAPYRSGQNPEQEHEKELGINEHVHTLWAYLLAFTRARLVPTSVQYAEGREGLAERRIAGKLLKLGTLPATLWALNAYPYAGMTVFARRL